MSNKCVREKMHMQEVMRQRALLQRLLSEEERVKQHLILRFEKQALRREEARVADEQSNQRIARLRSEEQHRSVSCEYSLPSVPREAVLEAKRLYSTPERRTSIIRSGSSLQ